jgi:hypothetical protein
MICRMRIRQKLFSHRKGRKEVKVHMVKGKEERCAG